MFLCRSPASSMKPFFSMSCQRSSYRYQPLKGLFQTLETSQCIHMLSGPDGSRHSTNKHRKDVNSENSNYCPIFVRDFLSSRRQTPEVWNFCAFTVFEFFHLPRNSRASRGRKFPFFLFFCGLKLLRASLKAPALTGYVGDAQFICHWSGKIPLPRRRPILV